MLLYQFWQLSAKSTFLKLHPVFIRFSLFIFVMLALANVVGFFFSPSVTALHRRLLVWPIIRRNTELHSVEKLQEIDLSKGRPLLPYPALPSHISSIIKSWDNRKLHCNVSFVWSWIKNCVFASILKFYRRHMNTVRIDLQLEAYRLWCKPAQGCWCYEAVPVGMCSQWMKQHLSQTQCPLKQLQKVVP
jgi:hypothetical protein